MITLLVLRWLSPLALGAGEIAALRAQLAAQQEQIEQLRAALEAQKQVLERLARAAENPPRVQEPAQKTESSFKSLNGFQFSGDFRFRADAQLRSGNQIAAPLQNLRSRYRLRLNIDKDLDPRFRFHLQLSTGPLNHPITNDQDMAGGVAKHPFSISEASVDFHPSPKFSVRGGRMEEVFADNLRFLWDDDVRFNGFQQILKTKLACNRLGLTGLEFRAGEYILSNPAVYVLPASSPYVAAGYQPGQKVRDANLFHPGAVLRGNLGSVWTHQITGGIEIYRHPNQIQLASTAAGYPVLVSGAIGLALSGLVGGAGNATTEPGGAVFSAPDFQIAPAIQTVV
ncbi:MAG: putative porin [Acidobacteria bacterium]|nr:putative porin [Acidobacteriota bacterium]